MLSIYIFGNGNISLSDFITYYQQPLQPYLINPNVSFILCDFKGTDTLAMELLKTYSNHVSIYHIGKTPRYTPDKYKTKVSQWIFNGGFIDDESRDHSAIDNCTHFLAIDFNSNSTRKSGTQKNIERCLTNKKIRIG